MSGLNHREKAVIRKRLKALKRERYLDHKAHGDTTAIDLKIKTLRQWLVGAPKKVAQVKAMSKSDFDKYMAAFIENKEQAKAIMQIPDRKTVDKLWPWLMTANIQIDCSPEIKEYIRNKTKKELRTL